MEGIKTGKSISGKILKHIEGSSRINIGANRLKKVFYSLLEMNIHRKKQCKRIY